MIKIFYGDDRLKAQEAVRAFLGAKYEVVEGEGVTEEMMPSIFFGVSLFSERRKIVIKDLSASSAWGKLIDYVGTPHDVVVWESKLDKRLATCKALAQAGVEAQEFKMPSKVAYNRVFDIYTTALRDGKRAVKMLEEIEGEEEPFQLVGLFTTQAAKGFRGGVREKRILKELAKLDLDMKSTTVEPWYLVKSFLIRLSSL